VNKFFYLFTIHTRRKNYTLPIRLETKKENGSCTIVVRGTHHIGPTPCL
jgi:hypothetical protein